MFVQVGIDATPLLGRRTGIGTYVQHLVAGLAARPGEVRLRATAFTVRGGGPPADLPAGTGWRHLPVPARLSRRAWRAGLPLPAALFAGRTDVFHGTNFVLPPVPGGAGVLTVHDLTYLRHPDWVDAASLELTELVPRGLRHAARVLTPSAAVAAELADAYPHVADRTIATPLGVDPGWAAAVPASPGELAALGLPPEYVLAVGTLEPRKGLDVLIAAHAAARREDPSVPPLVLVGPQGWGAGTHGADPGVVLPGYLDAAVLPSVVAAASVFAFPSRYEGFGLPPLEALAAGAPVIASDLPVTREVLGGHALFVPPGDPEALAAALLSTLTDPPGPAATAAVRRHALGRTWDDCVARTLTAYREAAS
ncbi:glycosyltransferase [Nakamurella sp. YIM 132087]|uniref:Glycosyltransferase n=1 Tax=Nakamurella alba TaxID=2665158 RepID=A0A7K1FJ83_9ACTN|nr:glycosyltransferase family 1 protein [Nakamurella alba]MTD14126.1 glycosyltransferase [Nakamurella alba]